MPKWVHREEGSDGEGQWYANPQVSHFLFRKKDATTYSFIKWLKNPVHETLGGQKFIYKGGRAKDWILNQFIISRRSQESYITVSANPEVLNR